MGACPVVKFELQFLQPIIAKQRCFFRGKHEKSEVPESVEIRCLSLIGAIPCPTGQTNYTSRTSSAFRVAMPGDRVLGHAFGCGQLKTPTRTTREGAPRSKLTLSSNA